MLLIWGRNERAWNEAKCQQGRSKIAVRALPKQVAKWKYIEGSLDKQALLLRFSYLVFFRIANILNSTVGGKVTKHHQ